ncbi:MAG: flagellar biosynthetic protein FliQ [Myxococcales bacterium]|nr:flagellar biosynthetic protein FliQ [Myxococcales bacterium]
MTPERALELLRGLFTVTIAVAAPLLTAALIAGVLIGVLQTATQVNEASVSFFAKVAAVVGVLVVFGPMSLAHIVGYARRCFEAVADVVH